MTTNRGWHLLDKESPGISARLRELGSRSRQALALRAALMVAANAPDVAAEDGETFLKILKTQGDLSAEQAKAAMAAAEIADDNYLDLQNKGRPRGEWEGCFRKARWLRGIAIAFGGSNLEHEDIVSVIYELNYAAESSQDFLRKIESEITALGKS